MRKKLSSFLLLLSNKKGSILAQTLILFMIFLSVYTPIMTLTLYMKTQPLLVQKAFKRIDMEIYALTYYHQNNSSLSHDDAMYEFNHWITYWFKEEKMIIWFDGFYDYQIEFTTDEAGNFIKRTYVYD